MNQLIVTGYMAGEAKRLIVGTEGNEVVKFTVANNSVGKSKKTNFISCSAWGKTGGLIEKYFPKGKPIMILGQLSTYSHKKEDGSYSNDYTVTVHSVEFALKSKDDGLNEPSDHDINKGNGYQPQGESRYSSDDDPQSPDSDVDDKNDNIPF